MVVLAVACSPVASPSNSIATPASTSPGTAATSTGAALTVGILVPFTESAINSDFGVAQQRAADLYVQQRGGKLGGRDVTLVYSDESVVPALDLVKATQLVEQQHADVLLGLIGTPGAYAVRDYVDDKKVVFIDTNASGNALTRSVPGCTPSCKSAYVFRSSYSSWQLSEPLGEWAAGHGASTFYVAYADDSFGSESAAAFGDGLEKSGGKATGSTAVSAGSDWTKVVSAIAAQSTKSVFAAFSGSDADGFITAWDAAHLTAMGYKLYGPGPLADVGVLASVNAAAAGITTASFWSSALDNPANRALMDLYSKTYQDETGAPAPVDSYVVEMWDGMKALDEALAAAGSASGDALAAALQDVRFDSSRGPFAFDANTHNVVQNIYIVEASAPGASVSNTVVATIPAVADPGQ